MTEKEIAKEILLKLIDVKAICLIQTPNTKSADEISSSNEANVRAVCVAYQNILKAVSDLKS